MRQIFLAMVLCVGLAAPAQAVIFWDDEMENPDSNGFLSPFFYNTHVFNNTMAVDTTVKFSGNGSVRLNFPASCQTLTTEGQCGGSASKNHPLTDDLYQRYYFRMSGTGPNPTTSGLFEVAGAFTKMVNTVSSQVNGLFTRSWSVMGCCGSKVLKMALENVPITNGAQTMDTTKTLQDNTWYCIETRHKQNTPGLNDGIMTTWVDGVQVGHRADVNWRRAGSTVQWKTMAIFRQIGAGNMWFDRLAAGDTRIGCLGAPNPTGDTTPPVTPKQFMVN